MRYSVLLLLSVLLSFSCKSEKQLEPVETVEVQVQDTTTSNTILDIKIVDYSGLKPFLNKTNDKVHVVNFWATWCAPCVKELPYFEKANDIYSNQGVEILLVSLDFPRQYETKLKPFLLKHQLKSEVIAFDDVDQNMWIPAIDEDWSGAIPATLIYKGDKRQFYEGSFTYEQLEDELKQFLN